jgi:hypothetical protein
MSLAGARWPVSQHPNMILLHLLGGGPRNQRRVHSCYWYRAERQCKQCRRLWMLSHANYYTSPHPRMLPKIMRNLVAFTKTSWKSKKEDNYCVPLCVLMSESRYHHNASLFLRLWIVSKQFVGVELSNYATKFVKQNIPYAQAPLFRIKTSSTALSVKNMGNSSQQRSYTLHY